MILISKGPCYSKKKALLIIFLSIAFIDGSAVAFFFLFKVVNKEKPVRVLVWNNQSLPGVVLAEMLGLSMNAPSTHSDKVYEARLLSYNIMEEAHVKYQRGGKLLVDYKLRQPIAYVGNKSNLAIDENGVLFPYLPFLLPSELPMIILERLSGPTLSENECALMMGLLQATAPFKVSTIDLSSAFAKSLGAREIVITLGKETSTYVRLSPLHFEKQLLNYQRLNKNMSASIVDLRMLDCALVKQDGGIGEST